ncbi:Transposase, IS605 OrfB [Lyngbya sp. PCC 8106]|nr:Transposase, IS605 OrfB [Lyngbya sp. PCC 8106]
MFFKANHFLSKYDLDKMLKTNPHFKALRAACAQQTLHGVVESFNSYKKLIKMYKRGELSNKPKLPKYRKKGGLAVVSYSRRWVKFTDGQLQFSLGKQVKAWFGIDNFTLPMPTNLSFDDIKEFRFTPRNNNFYLEFVYEQPKVKQVEKTEHILGIDPGLNNWLTCVSTTGKSFIIDGKKVKSQNQWYNKQVAKLKTGALQGYWDEQLAAVTEKRNRQMRDNVDKAARFIINWCLKNKVSTIVFGWNQRNKDGINIGKKNNQSFVQVPTAKLKSRIAQLCEQHGIEFVETEESYTSRSSFLDNDTLPTFGEKPVGEATPKELGWISSGKRVKRGLYRDSKGQLINADCNGAANIIRKINVSTQQLAKVVRGVLSLPHRYFLDNLSRSYRKQHCEADFNPCNNSAHESMFFKAWRTQYSPSLKLSLRMARLLYPILAPQQIPQIFTNLRRGRELGKQAKILLNYRFEENWERPLTEIKAELGLV